MLKQCSVLFPAGQTTFVVGPSGCGKSTLTSLLLKFYKPSGQINIDGLPLEKLSVGWLRRNITLVEQKSVLFNDTVSNNIAIAGEDVTVVEVLEALESSGLSGIIDELPNGLDTRITHGESSLSGGQCQRISLARARIRNSPILFLDESTSALDQTTQTSVLHSVLKWRRGRTTIIITHDMEQIKDEDFVHIMKDGRVLQSGQKKDLDAYEPLKSLSALDNTTRTNEGPIRHRRRARDAVPVFHPGLLSVALSGSFQDPFQAPAPRESNLHASWRPDTSQQRFLTGIELKELHRRNTEDILQGKDQIIRCKSRETCSDDKPQAHSSQQEPDESFSLWQLIRTILPALQCRYRLMLLLGIVTTIIHASSTPVFSYFFSQLLRAFQKNEDNSGVALRYSLAIIGIGLVNLLATYAQTFSMESAASQWTNQQRVQGFKRILSQPKAWFEHDDHSLASLTTALDGYGEEMRSILGQDLPMMLTAFVMLLIGAIWSIATCPKLALVGLACTPVMFGLACLDMRLTTKWTSKCNGATEDIAGTYTEVFLGIGTVKSLQLEQHFTEILDEKARLNIRYGVVRALIAAVSGGWNRGSVYFVFGMVPLDINNFRIRAKLIFSYSLGHLLC